MKRVVISCECTATVEEAWTFDIPDTLDLSGLTTEEAYNLLMGEEESPAGVVLVGVENVETNDERDRGFFRGHSVREVPQDPADDPTPSLAAVAQLIRENVETIAPVLAGMMANLGGKREWDMEDNFYTTERLAELAGQITGHSAGDQSADDLRFWHPVAVEAGFDPDDIAEDDDDRIGGPS